MSSTHQKWLYMSSLLSWNGQDKSHDMYSKWIILLRSFCECRADPSRRSARAPDESGKNKGRPHIVLSINDHQARRRFVEWAQNEIAVVPDFHKRILFSDEAHFWLNGYVNKHNCRIWSEASPQVYVETPLHPEKLTVWCALWADYFLWGYVKSLVYADKPQTLDHLKDNIRRVVADIRPQMLEKVIENWTSRLDYILASRGSPVPEIIFKM
ncbi:uncharacterized protein TNCV_1085631 [Trichonephila clavipes]|nr:uncharacterized protein TNCV_1085631 [Trichonephila clavipes]